jgi:hypothetical protein
MPDIVFYCAILRAFIYLGNLDDAERVVARITQAYGATPATGGHTSGQNAVIDKLVEDLAELRRAKKYEASAICVSECTVI